MWTQACTVSVRKAAPGVINVQSAPISIPVALHGSQGGSGRHKGVVCAYQQRRAVARNLPFEAVRDHYDESGGNRSLLIGGVVPAEDRRPQTADHWDFEGEAVCIPQVSSSGHGKAHIKRIHYQQGKFALATTMCALFVENTAELRPRFLHLFLEAAKEELLAPFMCGGTNVTMNSDQLADVLVPFPDPRIYDEYERLRQWAERWGLLMPRSIQ